MCNEQLTNTTSLLTGQLVRLTALDAEKDVEIIARWDADAEYMRQVDSGPQRLSRAQKIREGIEKQQAEDSRTVEFAVRALADENLIGFVAFDGIDWRNGDTFAAIGIGDPAYRGQGYGTDAMRILLRYGFQELNLGRIQLNVFSYNERAIKSYLKIGFSVEGRQRGMLLRDGQRWDFIYMGVLRDEWKAMTNAQ